MDEATFDSVLKMSSKAGKETTALWGAGRLCKNKTQVDKKRVEATRVRGVVRLFVGWSRWLNRYMIMMAVAMIEW